MSFATHSQVLPRVGTGQLTNEQPPMDADRDSGTESDAENAEIMALVEGMSTSEGMEKKRYTIYICEYRCAIIS